MSTYLEKNILQNLSVLYIEDEQNIRNNIVKTLRMLAKDVYAYENAEDALTTFQNNNIDIIISDINLPKMDGLELSKSIREKDDKIPIILLTAHLDTNYLLYATKLKLVDYLIKPVDFDTLNAVLQKAANEVVKNARYEVQFKNKTRYNVQKKCLFTCEDMEIALTISEIELLEFMIQHHHRIISQDEIKVLIWNDSLEATDSALKNLLNKLRKKIGKESISNISGVGYKVILNH